jgi:hypothetical protein
VQNCPGSYSKLHVDALDVAKHFSSNVKRLQFCVPRRLIDRQHNKHARPAKRGLALVSLCSSFTANVKALHFDEINLSER